MIYKLGVMAVLCLPVFTEAGPPAVISFQPSVTQSGGYTFFGGRMVLAGFLGLSYDRALVANRYNKGVFAVMVGYQPARSGFFGFLGLNFGPGVKAGVHDPVKRSSLPYFFDLGGKIRLFGSKDVGVCLSPEVKYYFNPGFAFSPIGLAPALGLVVELGG